MDLFSNNQRVALNFIKDTKLVEMFCTIEEVSDDRLILNLPQYFMRYINFLQTGCNLTAKAFSKNGTVDFNTIVISSPLEDVFSIELDYNSVKFTANNELPLVNATENIEVKINDGTLNLKTIEISAEFLKIDSGSNSFNLNDTLEFKLHLPSDYGTINFRGIITEKDSVYDNEYTVRYSTITENHRQNLLYYMYMYDKDSD
ncbi:MAG: flagellar brake domain-containing protein [bacterium]|nr:flagellar brake domain-containing protein [bacterium]